MRSLRTTVIGLSALVLLTLALLTTARTARAAASQNEAWEAAKNVLPPGSYVIAGADMTQVQRSVVFQQVWPALAAASGGIKQGMDAMRATCQTDALASVRSVVLAFDIDKEQGILFFAVSSGATRFVECLASAMSKQKAHVGAPDASKIAAVTSGGKSGYVSLLSTSVFAFTTDPMDRALLAKWTNGGLTNGATPELKRALAGVNTNAALWGVLNKQQAIDPNTRVKVAYGSVDLKAGNLVIDVRLVLGSAKSATDLARLVNGQIAQMTQKGLVPPEFKPVMQSLKIAAAGDELVGTVTVPENQLLSIIGAAMGS